MRTLFNTKPRLSITIQSECECKSSIKLAKSPKMCNKLSGIAVHLTMAISMSTATWVLKCTTWRGHSYAKGYHREMNNSLNPKKPLSGAAKGNLISKMESPLPLIRRQSGKLNNKSCILLVK